ncbi:PREDICTED: low affinity immunoglobulin epsilon Fc receptor isoform X2 [Chinchilla lanigera]|uniref:low affinity immunoglobulin epsilon Fc receptor isoform X2 n=1 Tax=Chinchilla lanigera TaxID=34839 RepID=UPI00069681F6|nr:PREDICTED: low affinity immunoglobulin epsilon Fc receptor isoform X2 [Chinchilla lanigera]
MDENQYSASAQNSAPAGAGSPMASEAERNGNSERADSGRMNPPSRGEGRGGSPQRRQGRALGSPGREAGTGAGPALEAPVPEEFFEFPRKRCCRRGLQLVLLGLLTVALWAGLLTLLLLWREDTPSPTRPRTSALLLPTPHPYLSPGELISPLFPPWRILPAPSLPSPTPPWVPRKTLIPGDRWDMGGWGCPPPLLLPGPPSSPDWDTLKNVKQLEVAAAQNVSRIAKELHRHQSDRTAQKSQALMSQTVHELQAEQKQLKSQGSELSSTLDRLQEDLSSVKSQNLNEKHTALDSLGRLKEEVAKLWMEIQASKGSACNTCPEQWVNFQQKCYYFGKGPKQWIQARFSCEDLEGRLVSIHSQEEQDFLTKHANKEDSWIGLRDLDIEGEFIWTDGRPVDYSNWQPGEPNNADQGEHCVMMLGSGGWNDAFCRSQLDAWVCEQLAACGSAPPSDPTDDSVDAGSASL